MRHEPHLEWKDRIANLDPMLIYHTPVAEANCLDEFSSLGKFTAHDLSGEICRGFDLVLEFIRKEVPVIWLTINTEH